MNDFTPSRLNLSDWALRHRAIVLFAMIVLAVIGVLSYQRLGQSENPPFTFKVMLIRTLWPGATTHEVMNQITDRLERKLQETPHVDRIQSFSKPGESVILFIIKDSAPASEVEKVWYQVRKKVADIRESLPQGVRGPFFNDEFGDVYGNIYALHGEGFSMADLKRHADRLRAELLRVPDVNKVDYFGEQDERIFIEISNAKLATLGIDINTIVAALQAQNAISASGAFETATDRVALRASGTFETADDVRETTIRAANRVIRIGDLGEVKRGFVDPPAPATRFAGKPALAIGVSMAAGGDIIALGHNLDALYPRLVAELPVGMELTRVVDQPNVVRRSIREFVRSLTEALAIVLAVSFLSLGLRTGIVVALSIPLVLAATFFFMRFFDIGLHQISLGALVLSLGLLVDDAIIAVEMMARKMEQGWERMKAASFAYESTAMPMLSGTLITAAGFLPIATAQSATGEYTRSLFQVTVIALLVSWVAAVVFIPYLGYKLLPDLARRSAPTESPVYRFLRRLLPFLPAVSAKPAHGVDDEDAVYQTAFFRAFRRVVEWCVDHRWLVIGTTVLLFIASIAGFRFVQQQFFPASTRLELLIHLRLPTGASFTATEGAVKRVEAVLAKEPGIDNWIAYVGTGSPRFYLALDQQQPNTHFAEFMVNARSIADREALRARMIRLFDESFPDLRASILRLENGPPVGFPVQFRVSGPEIAEVRRIAAEVATVMRANAHLANVQFDWDERSKVVRFAIDQEKARLLGLTSQDIRGFLATSVNGFTVTALREENRSIDIVLRGDAAERTQLGLIEDLTIPTRAGKSVPITQIARIHYELEEGLIWRRNRFPTITVRANVYGDIQAPTVTSELRPLLAPIESTLPFGYRIETGGTVEDSERGERSVQAGFPLFILVVLTVLILQLQSFSQMLLVLLTAPLGLIGVTAFLIAFNQPFGFVAQLGVIALTGMIMRNSVILVDQIGQDVAAGIAEYQAVVGATVRRCRPIVLTALAAVIAMLPLSRSAFYGPMAVAIMGGLIVATLLTLLFLPALYAAWFRVHRDGT